ncbi:MAG: hypothetical protein BroJett040_05620 [Oligoflexia bacterium]|nr:MAG: hypothetical protein BroJett040_05620 [Oligoflexia bacterium]
MSQIRFDDGNEQSDDESEMVSDQDLIQAAHSFANECPAPDISLTSDQPLPSDPTSSHDAESFVQLADFVKKEHQRKKYLTNPKTQANISKYLKYEQAKPENIQFEQKGLQINKAA